MATTKLWPVKNKLGDVAAYDINPLKTTYDEVIMPKGLSVADVTVDPCDDLLISGINCDPKKAMDDFMDVKRKFEKFDGVLAYHGYISFPGIDGLDPVNVLSVAREMANEMWGDKFQVLLCVHTNTETLHCHVLVNSVSFVDGHKAVHNEKNYYRFKNIVDSVCNKYDLTIPKQNERLPLNYEYLEQTLVRIRMMSPDVESLKENLEKENITYCGRNYIRIKNDGRFVRLSRIKQEIEDLFDYSKTGVKEETQQNVSSLPDDKQEKKQAEKLVSRGV